MAKKAALSVRIDAAVKKELDKAAAKDHRSTTSLINVILEGWLRDHLAGKSKAGE
jgi:hypothetical protein